MFWNGPLKTAIDFSSAKYICTIPLESSAYTFLMDLISSRFSGHFDGGDILHNLGSKDIVSMFEGLFSGLDHFPVFVTKSRGKGRKSNISKAKDKACEEMTVDYKILLMGNLEHFFPPGSSQMKFLTYNYRILASEPKKVFFCCLFFHRSVLLGLRE